MEAPERGPPRDNPQALPTVPLPAGRGETERRHQHPPSAADAPRKAADAEAAPPHSPGEANPPDGRHEGDIPDKGKQTRRTSGPQKDHASV